MKSNSSLIAIVTSSFLLTALGFLLYRYFGLSGVTAVLPFVATLAIAFIVAHLLDLSTESDNTARKISTQESTSVSTGQGEHMLGAKKATALPKRRRVADWSESIDASWRLVEACA